MRRMLLKLLTLCGFFLFAQGDIRPRMFTTSLDYRPHNRTSTQIHQMHGRHDRMLQGDSPILGTLALGYYYAFLWIGSPPQRASVILDTGSSITAIPCSSCQNCGHHMDPPFDPAASTSNEQVMCREEACGQLYQTKCGSGDRCSFSQHYSESSSLKGNFVRDVVWFSSTGEKEFDSETAFGGVPFEFGCCDTVTVMFQTQLADGIMGLSGERTILKVMYDAGKVSAMVLGMCIHSTGGHLTLGGFEETLHTGPLKYTTLRIKRRRFTVELEDIKVAGQSSGSLSEYTAGYGAVMDSGTTYSYLPTRAFNSFREAFNKGCTRCPERSSRPGPQEHTCFQLTEQEKEQRDSLFPPLEMLLSGGVVLRIPPSQYMTMSGSAGQWCVNIYDNGNSGTLVGANLLQHFNVVYDLDQMRLGIAPANCGHTLSPSVLAANAASNTGSNTPQPEAASNTPQLCC